MVASKVAMAPCTGAFGRSLQDLARAGRPPVVLLDCLKWLAKFALTAPGIFSSASDKRKLLALKHLYDNSKRPLRNKTSNKDPVLVANLLLLWLGSLPEPMFPAEYVPDLLKTQHNECYSDRIAAVRGFLKKTEPFLLEALFPLFEFLHHHVINQADRDHSLQELGSLFAPFIFGTPQEYGLPEADASLLADTAELMIAEYRPLFTQPYGLNRFEQDTARAAAESGKLSQGLGRSQHLAPVQTVSFASAGEQEQRLQELACFWTPSSVFAESPRLSSSSPVEETDFDLLGYNEQLDFCSSDDAVLGGMLSSLLESTVSAVFDEQAAVGYGAAFDACAPCRTSPFFAAPMDVPFIRRVDDVIGDEFTPVDSFTSEDWGSVSPTGVVLGDNDASFRGVEASQHSGWSCKSDALHSPSVAPHMSELGAGSTVLA